MFRPQANAMSHAVPRAPSRRRPYEYECPTVTLSDTGQVTWSAAAVVAAQSADPSLSVARFKRCVSGAFKIAPSYSGGVIKSSTLFVDGRKKSDAQRIGAVLAQRPQFQSREAQLRDRYELHQRQSRQQVRILHALRGSRDSQARHAEARGLVRAGVLQRAASATSGSSTANACARSSPITVM